MGLILGEASLLGLLGGGLGLAATTATLWLLDHGSGLMLAGLSGFELRPQVALLGLGVAWYVGATPPGSDAPIPQAQGAGESADTLALDQG